MNLSSLVDVITNAPVQPIIIITDAVFTWLKAISMFPILALCLLGIATNIINILVFFHQGLLSSSHIISLFTLSLSDLLALVFRIPVYLCEVIEYAPSPVMVSNCKTVTFFYLVPMADIMSRYNLYITAYIAMERCLCVLMPLKVQRFFTPRAALVTMTIIWLSGAFLCGTFYAFTSLILIFDVSLNATMAVVVQTEAAESYSTFLLFFSYTFLFPTSVVISAVATGLMIYRLKAHQKWRQRSMIPTGQAATSGFNEATNSVARRLDKDKKTGDVAERHRQVMSTERAGTSGMRDVNVGTSSKLRKDANMMKMVLVVTSMFCICQTLGLIPGLALAFVSDTTYTGPNKNLLVLAFTYQTLFDCINSSLNFFFYKKISNQYRKTFRKVFERCYQ